MQAGEGYGRETSLAFPSVAFWRRRLDDDASGSHGEDDLREDDLALLLDLAEEIGQDVQPSLDRRGLALHPGTAIAIHR